jgi:hypothetical protein
MQHRFSVILLCLIPVAMLGASKPALPDAQTAFAFEGKPVHPGVVREFEVWLSDADPPRVKTVDVKACMASNKNFDPPTKEASGFLTCKTNDGWFSYRHVGVTPTGTHVLITASNGGGTMDALYVYLLRWDKEEYWTFEPGKERPTTQQRVVLKCIGQIVLGDRDDGTIELQGSMLTLGKSRYREKSAVYRLP